MDQPVSPLPFPIVGIGASAGGLEALEQFFRKVPPESGMAFVVIQHLSPEHQGALAQILARYTHLPVHQISDDMPVTADQVYVIAPGCTLTLEAGRLRLGDSLETRGQYRPLDDFLRSLAQEQKQRAIAVILSGIGTNGTAGAQAVKAVGGICLAQTLGSAAFEGMPQSLIHAGYADQVLEPAEMPAALIRYFANPQIGSPLHMWHAHEPSPEEYWGIDEVLTLVRARTRHDFSGYRKSTLLRRIQRRMGLAGITQVSDYAAALRVRGDEVAALANDLTINVTGFFRDAPAWEALRTSVIDPLCDSKGEGECIRAWVTACASGEEAYTLAICLAEGFRVRGVEPPEIKIFATDMADGPLALARAGVFPSGIEGDIPADLLERYFLKDEYTYRVKKTIRDLVVFARHDILRDPPFSRIDLCTCRNLLIYLEPQTQRRVISMLHFALRTGGFVLLGNTESCEDHGQFEWISRRWRIFRKTGAGQTSFSSVPGFLVRPPNPDEPAKAAERPAGVLLLQRALLERFGPPTVVVDRAEHIVYFLGATDEYLRQPAGEPTRELLRLVRPVLRVVVQSLLRTAVRDNRLSVRQIELPESTTSGQRLEITAGPVIQSRDPEYFLVSFRTIQVAAPAGVRVDVHAPLPDETGVYDELRLLRTELQNTTEAYEATSEELKASNEEATSVNEELQSANEELKTSREELQAVNEELTTVNGQLQRKIEQLQAATHDFASLLSSTNIAVLFLNRELQVVRFTPRVTDLLRLIESDIGRAVTDIALKFNDEKLLEDARAVLNDLIPAERIIESHAGRRYLRRTLPYRSQENIIGGVVIMFVDV